MIRPTKNLVQCRFPIFTSLGSSTQMASKQTTRKYIFTYIQSTENRNRSENSGQNGLQHYFDIINISKGSGVPAMSSAYNIIHIFLHTLSMQHRRRPNLLINILQLTEHITKISCSPLSIKLISIQIQCKFIERKLNHIRCRP